MIKLPWDDLVFAMFFGKQVDADTLKMKAAIIVGITVLN
jgi:hypothetical protein